MAKYGRTSVKKLPSTAKQKFCTSFGKKKILQKMANGTLDES